MPKDYIKNKDLYAEMIRCQDASINASTELVMMFYKISTRLSTKFQYKYPDDRADCIQGAVIDCYMYWRGFDRTKSTSAFAYITSLIHNGFKKTWRKLHQNISQYRQVSLSRNNIHSL